MDVMAKVAPGLYNAAREALGIDRSAAMDPQAVVAKPVGPSFGETLAEAARQTLAGLQRAEAVSKDAVVGKADPHSVVEALAATEMALETAVTVRDRVVEAYQEILRMPVRSGPAARTLGAAMTESQILDVLREGLWVSVLIALPILTVALVVGLAIGLLQALTSIQELTLTFVPKLGAILITFWLSMNFMGRLLIEFYQQALIPLIIGS